MFTFLGDASRAYTKHFQKALQAIGQKEDGNNLVTSLGPSVIIFQETMNTKPLVNTDGKSPEDIIRERFSQAELPMSAFSSIKYVGVQTQKQGTDFKLLRDAIKQETRNNSVRSARTPDTVYLTLKNLNNKFSGHIENNINVFFDQYFTCTVRCLSCDSRCQNSMNHISEKIPHSCTTKCRFQHQYQNQVHICKKCYNNGIYNEVIKRDIGENSSNWLSMAQYVWSGYVMECKTCGEIYHSRKYWVGNSNPEDIATRTEIVHIWNEGDSVCDTQNTAQWLLDSVAQISEAVTNATHQPTKVVTSWVADQINPTYWRPNHEISECYKCHKAITFTDDKHHCRDCGEGFCDACSSKKREVPERGWYKPVRICDICYERTGDVSESSRTSGIAEDVTIRQVSETVISTISAVGSVFNYPKELIKEHSRPSYWVPDSEITNCCLCEVPFIESNIKLHHCRACGRGVCHNCSQHKKPVPRRNWPDPVRVCDACVRND